MTDNCGSSETAPRGCLWWEQGQRPPARRALDGDRAADVVIIGAGYTGLWTAYRLQTTLTSLWPDLSDAVVTHRWGGVLGVPGTWEPFVTHDPSTGMWAAGGYTGDGVLFSNLVGRMLAAGIAEWENVAGTVAIRHRRPRGWEPEPLRWLAVRLIDSLALHLDRRERQGRRNRIMGRLCDWVVDKSHPGSPSPPSSSATSAPP